jgi:hypothetical protein
MISKFRHFHVPIVIGAGKLIRGYPRFAWIRSPPSYSPNRRTHDEQDLTHSKAKYPMPIPDPMVLLSNRLTSIGKGRITFRARQQSPPKRLSPPDYDDFVDTSSCRYYCSCFDWYICYGVAVLSSSRIPGLGKSKGAIEASTSVSARLTSATGQPVRFNSPPPPPYATAPHRQRRNG